jgi:hypothetical protein
LGIGINQENMSLAGIDGIPLRIQSFYPGVVSTLEAVELKTEVFGDADFSIPKYFMFLDHK